MTSKVIANFKNAPDLNPYQAKTLQLTLLRVLVESPLYPCFSFLFFFYHFLFSFKVGCAQFAVGPQLFVGGADSGGVRREALPLGPPPLRYSRVLRL